MQPPKDESPLAAGASLVEGGPRSDCSDSEPADPAEQKPAEASGSCSTMDSQRGRGKEVTFSCRNNAEAKKTTNFFLDRFSIPINLNFQDTMIFVTM